MKQITKICLVAIVFALIATTFAACSVKGLSSENEAIGSPETVARNKEPYSASFVPYETVEQALGCDFSKSPYYRSLNGTWDFTLVYNPHLVPENFQSKKFVYEVSEDAQIRKSENDETVWSTIQVPSNWELQGYDTPEYTYDTYSWGTELVAPQISDTYNPVGIYRNNINIPSDWSGRQVYVSFDGVASCVYVYVNGALVGYAEDSYTGKTFNITDAVTLGKDNLIVFAVYKYCDASYLEANDSLKMGGIYRDVYLYSAPEIQLRDLQYDMQMSGNDALLNATISLASYKKKPGSDYNVKVSVYDKNGNEIVGDTLVGANAVFPESISSSANAYTSTVGGRVLVPSPKLWSAEDPNLYTMVIKLFKGDNLVDLTSKEIGFKTTGLTVDENGNQVFIINDKPISIQGILYNENSAVNGMAITEEELIADIKMMKSLNINAVRSPGRPLSPKFISLCDQFGIYVVDDISLNSNPYANMEELSIPGDQSIWQTACLDRLLNVIYRDRNAASVIMWSIGNNSGIGTNFSVLKTWLTDTDDRIILYDADPETSDLYIASDTSLNELVQFLNDKDNKKAVLIQATEGALLNNGGNFSAYAELIDEHDNFQGGFFGYWSDNALFWPQNASDAATILRNTPYSSENSDLYALTYAVNWQKASTFSSDAKHSLAGVVSADRTQQAEAAELRNALSPIYISVEDVSSGTFRVTNRNSFTKLQGSYSIAYEILNGADSVKNGTVTIDLEPSESKCFTVDLGPIPSDSEYYIYFTVTDTVKHAWSTEENAVVFAKQFALTDSTIVPKDGSVQTVSGESISVESLQIPKIYVSNYTLAKNKIYITNYAQQNLDDLFSLSWIVYECNNLWDSPRWVVYDEGTLKSLNVPAGAENKEVSLNINNNGGCSSCVYAAYLVLTTKNAIGDIPEGTEFYYGVNIDQSGYIPFKSAAARTPVEVDLDGDGQIDMNSDGEPLRKPAECDTEPEVKPEDLFDLPVLESTYSGNSFLTFKNGSFNLTVNTETGLLTDYTVKGQQILVGGNGETAGMISNLLRNPTGGDLASSTISQESLLTLQKLSQDNAHTKVLPSGHKLTKPSANQFRLEMDFVWVTYPIASSRAFRFDSNYTVVYDIYSTGEIQVSVKYAPSSDAPMALELSNLFTISVDFTKMSWYGMGKASTYADRTGDAKIGIYKDQKISDYIGSEYLYRTGSGDITNVRWASFERDDGTGIVITSDSNLFAFSVAKDYPWTQSTYAPAGEEAGAKNTVVHLIGQQRGVGANDLFDQQYSNATLIEPGITYAYSFRIVPVDANYDANKISKTTLPGAVKLNATNNLNVSGGTFALSNAVSADAYLSGNDETVTTEAALGNASQIWYKEAVKTEVEGTFLLKNDQTGLYLSPCTCAKSGVQPTEAEITVAKYKGDIWQTWTYTGNVLYCTKFYTASTRNYSLILCGSTEALTHSGARMALSPARSASQSLWTLEADENNENKLLIKSNHSGKYLTVVHSMKYSDPLVSDYAYRVRNYYGMTNWQVESMWNAKPYASNDPQFAGSANYVTQWELLPAATQMWTFKPASGGYQIINKGNGKALTLSDNGLIETTATGGTSQIWSVVNCNGMYGIVNISTNMALTMQSINGEKILGVQQWNNLAIQKWNFASESDLQVDIIAGSNWY